jgi:hypothetical protein
MQQGTAKKLEDMRAHDRPGVPLNIEVAVGGSGTAVIRDYHWEPLGITVTFEREARPAAIPTETGPATDAQRRQQLITGVTVELKNYGPTDVAIVDLPDAGSFRLVPDERWQEARYRWVGESTPRATSTPAATHLIVLKPGQAHTTKIDLKQPAWFIRHAGPGTDPTAFALRDATDPWSASFRVEYAPPSKIASAHLPHAELIRHGRIRSRAFNAAAGLD